MSDQLVNLVCYERFDRLNDDTDTLASKVEVYGRTGGIMRLTAILVGALL